MGAQSLIFQGFREKMCESVPATGVAAERGCGRGRVVVKRVTARVTLSPLVGGVLRVFCIWG